MRVLLVEDNLTCSENLKRSLFKAGFDCDVSHYGSEGFEMIRNSSYDAVIADIGLPDFTGNELIQKIRVIGAKDKGYLPILVISGNSSVDSKVESFVCGADDFLPKPFDARELIARIHSVVRRSRGYSSNIIQVGKGCEVDIGAKEVRINGKKVNLTSKEYDLFELLSLRKGSSLSKRNILDYLYGGINTPTPKIIDVVVCKIRNKLMKHTRDTILETVWGTGYKIGSNSINNTPTSAAAA